MTPSDLKTIDRSDMHKVLRDFPDQVEHAIRIGQSCRTLERIPKGRHVVFLGMGGSAIGGDLIRSFISAQPEFDARIVSVVRNYRPPAFLTADDLVVASSYSGDTEETLSAFEAAIQVTRNALCISSGGELTRRAEEEGFPCIEIPGGLQPRCALGYSFFPLLIALNRAGVFGTAVARDATRQADETLALLGELAAQYSIPSSRNPTLALASKLKGKIPVVYSACEQTDAVNLRWRGQIQENAKQLAFGNLLPEMNHNEINGWQYPKALTTKFVPILLRDSGDHPRVAARLDILKGIIRKPSAGVVEIRSRGDSLLARMFSLIAFGDWTSYYLAILNKVDPSPVPTIQSLKRRLAEIE